MPLVIQSDSNHKFTSGHLGEMERWKLPQVLDGLFAALGEAQIDVIIKNNK